MVKKSIIAIAVVALLVTTVHAGSPSIKKDGDWPWTYKAINLCTMDVYMEVGHFVQLEECHKREIVLKQETCSDMNLGGGDFPCYRGCEEISVRANFPAIFGASLSKEGGILDKTSVYWKDDKNQIQGSVGDWEKLTVCIDAWKAQVWKASEANKKTKVGELTINVKPPDSDS